jgi:hypothetical protein
MNQHFHFSWQAAIFLAAWVSTPAGAGPIGPDTVQTIPVTAVSFPKEVIATDGGRIEFFARLDASYTGSLTVGGSDPHFFQIYDGTSTFQMGFNANDGVGNNGLVGVAGNASYTGSGDFTYEDVYGAGKVHRWHYHVFKWDKDGNLGGHKIELYIDGALKSASWHDIGGQSFPPLAAGTFNLITTAGPLMSDGGPVLMQELRIYNRNGDLLLYNTLHSKKAVEHSVVGPNGSFNGGGDASFVAGGHGMGHALRAFPVGGLGEPSQPQAGRTTVH